MEDSNVLIKKLLEAGVHFGHQTNRWNPKMAKFIFGEKNDIYIIDLQKTIEGINNACQFLKDVVIKGGHILFVGTKKQAQSIIREHARRCGVYYVVERWLGGTLTNFTTIRKSVKRLEELEGLKKDGTFDLLSKKEKAQITKELEKLLKNLEGIRDMNRLPNALFIVDSKIEEIAVKEANKLSIPVVAIVDTNADPDKIDYIIPGNDDAIRSIELITQIITDCIFEAREEFLKGVPQEDIEAALEEHEIKTDEEDIKEIVGRKVKEDTRDEPIRKKSRRKPQRTA